MSLSAGEHIAPELAGNALERGDLTMFHFVGRLRRGVRDGEAEAALDSIARRFEREKEGNDRSQKERHVRLLPGGKALPVSKQDRPVFTEFFIVLGGTVLLIACANLMNMTLARAANRRREIAVRLSIGASRGRIIRQLVTESMLLAGGAFLAGFGLAVWIMHGASQLRMPFPSPITFGLNPDWHAFVFTAALAAVAGFVFGLVPAWQATRVDLTSGLKEGTTVRLQRFRRLNLRNLLVLSQISGSLTLLLLTGLIVLGTQTNMASQAGFDPENLYLLSIDPVRDGFSAGGAETLLRNLLERVKTMASVRAACLTETVPLAISGSTGVKFLEQAELASSRAMYDAQKYVVGRDYFETLGIEILEGRGSRKEDESETSTGAVVSEAFVNQYWKGENALGRRIEIWRGDLEPSLGVSPGTVDYRAETSGRKPQLFEVVGVVKDVQQGLESESRDRRSISRCIRSTMRSRRFWE